MTSGLITISIEPGNFCGHHTEKCFLAKVSLTTITIHECFMIPCQFQPSSLLVFYFQFLTSRLRSLLSSSILNSSERSTVSSWLVGQRILRWRSPSLWLEPRLLVQLYPPPCLSQACQASKHRWMHHFSSQPTETWRRELEGTWGNQRGSVTQMVHNLAIQVVYRIEQVYATLGHPQTWILLCCLLGINVHFVQHFQSHVFTGDPIFGSQCHISRRGFTRC